MTYVRIIHGLFMAILFKTFWLSGKFYWSYFVGRFRVNITPLCTALEVLSVQDRLHSMLRECFRTYFSSFFFNVGPEELHGVR